MRLKDLSPHPKNPRKISDEKKEMLKKSMSQFGCLDGFVFNRANGLLAGSHQRHKIIPSDAEIVIEKAYDEPTDKGTVADGYVLFEGERFKYREVFWDDPTHEAAMIAANQQGGIWDYPLLIDIMSDLDAANIDMDVLGFDEKETTNLMAPTKDPTDKDSRKCPKCGYKW